MEDAAIKKFRIIQPNIQIAISKGEVRNFAEKFDFSISLSGLGKDLTQAEFDVMEVELRKRFFIKLASFLLFDYPFFNSTVHEETGVIGGDGIMCTARARYMVVFLDKTIKKGEFDVEYGCDEGSGFAKKDRKEGEEEEFYRGGERGWGPHEILKSEKFASYTLVKWILDSAMDELFFCNGCNLG